MPSICLNMIVKNEAAIIERCLHAVKPIIDFWVIVDTGSTDHTKELIYRTLEGIPGELHDRPWVNFEHNRTQAIQLAKGKSDFTLILDADEVIQISPDFTKFALQADGFYIRYTGDIDYANLLLVRSSLNWFYKGVTHEFIDAPNKGHLDTLKTLKIDHREDGGSKADKYRRDINLLIEGIKHEPKNARYRYYLANSYRDSQQYGKALDYYLSRTYMGGWDEEVFSAQYEAAKMMEKLNLIDEAEVTYLKAFDFRPSRAEPLYQLARLCNKRKRYASATLFAEAALRIPYPSDRLFVERPVYTHLTLFEFSISTFYVGRYEDSLKACDALIKIPELPRSYREQTTKNRTYPAKKLGV